jgi:hypothetical protein
MVNTFERKETEICGEIDGNTNVISLARNNESIYIETYRKGKPVHLMNRIVYK